MTDQEPEATETSPRIPTAPSTSASPPDAVAATHVSQRQPKRRAWMPALFAVALLATLLSASILTAQGLSRAVALAPEVSLSSTLRAGAGAQASGAKPITSVNAAACNCSSKRSSYTAPPFQPSGAGQVVVVSIAKQQLWAYQDGQLVLTSLVTTGMPQLPTPRGTFHIMMKEANVWFYSPWPYGSPYYYSPEHINYAMLFRSGGFYIHDAPWRETFGPGTNVPHTEPDGKYATGSHGCVNMPTSTARQLYAWIGIGATVIIE